jgi:1-acyl-sn-glycerol-3-phosphate acyltransferase
VPQTSARSSDEAVMTPREVALAARRSIDVAHERLRLGEALLVFPEGTRSRTGHMQRLLTGAARYLEMPDTWVLPMGLVGTERLFPMSEDSINPVRIILTIGRPLPARLLVERSRGDRQLVMDEIGRAIAALLPPEYRGTYGDARETDCGSV